MSLELHSNPEVEKVFSNYPKLVQKQMYALRELVLETAKEIEEITKLEETLKWGEPSYITKTGSTLRMDWKAKTPTQYALYFKCTSRLVETFKLHFKNTFTYEGKRAIVFNLEDEIPKEALKHCIKATLMYHKVKHLPTLGI
ncbi:DUF1801 domain-containing protein [Cellulophaga tyrosinoxydans]|uniref:YdhG-like domain-containing protein n=1 Tax=Cellulophaga tyrosinoxydans TaxID=504486 RepID=A0A1W2AY15_9FLAO|nr:DUF1801 domain-containing protein [Cellulophaga tyrosinoxydans]SMC65586.1 protein of unknown function (DU1801) [Cellulophaga tyrosinoxydans]